MTLIRHLQIAVVCAFAAAAPVRAQTLFSDTFSDGSTSGWTQWGDIMHDGGGVFRNSCCNADAHYSIDAGAAWTDYTYSVDHYADDDDISGITFRIQDSNNFYLLTQGFADNDGWNLRLSKVVGGSQSDLIPPIDNQGGAAGQVNSEDTWYAFKVELVGTSIKCYIDDVLKFDITDSTYATGTAGVWMEGQTAQCRFDNALVVGASLPLAENYRSIGTNSGVLYSTGNASISSGATTMTFAGATLPSNVGVGDEITVGGDTYFIRTKDSSSQVTVHTTSAATHSNAAYSIRRAYNTIQSWESGRDGDLVGENRCEYGVCYNDGPFTTTTTINGSTTDATHHMTLTVADGQRHDGTGGTGVVIDGGGGFGTAVIDIKDQYTHVEWLEITDWKDNQPGLHFDDAPASDNSDNSSTSHMLMHDFGLSDGSAAFVVRSDGIVIRNCMIYDGVDDGIFQSDGSLSVENCTMHGVSDGIKQYSGSSISVRNTITLDSVDDDYDLEGTVTYFDYNMYETTEDFTPSGSNDQTPPADLANLFVSISSGNEDLHLLTSGHNALDTGLDLSADFSTDIDGETRTGSWDLGADEMTSTLAVNYRSIGTDSGVLYSTGNASITSGSSTMTFAGGAGLPSNVGPGDEITIGGDTYYIKAKTSATQVTVDSPSASTHTSLAYSIRRAYNDIQVWENARDGNLVAENRREIAVFYDDGVFVPGAEIDINGSTTDSTHTITLTAAEGQRHSGVAGTGVVIDGASDGTFRVRDDYVTFEWLEIRNFTGAWRRGILVEGSNVLIQNVMIHDFASGYQGILLQPGHANLTVRNTIIYNGYSGIYLESGSGATTLENITMWNMSEKGVHTGGGPISVANCIVVDNGNGADDDFVLYGSISYFGYNMYDGTYAFSPASYQGNNQSPPANSEDLFISIAPGSEDFHLERSGHNAIDTGVDRAGYTTDFEGETRDAGQWDLGADEAVGFTNYRSIGTAGGTIYSTGSGTVAAAGRTVTFAGATLPANIGQGDELVIGGETMYIMSRDSATQVTTQDGAAGAHTAAGYTISRVYNTIQAWETARQGDLVGDTRREVGVCYDDSEFTPSGDTVIDGSTTNATYYMMVTVAEGQRHSGVAGGGVSINGANATDQVFEVLDDNFAIEWLEIRNFAGVQVEAFDLNADDTLLQNLIIHDFDGAESAIYSENPFILRNTIFYDGSFGIYADGAQDLTIQNSTIRDMTTSGIVADNSTVVIANSIIVGCTTDIELNSCTIDYFGYNMYSTTSGFTPSNYDGNNQSPPADLDDLFFTIAPSSEDLHLEDSGHNAVGTGLDLSADFTLDLDGQTRTSPWDIGADAVVAPLWISSGQNQTFSTGDADTAISPITVTDGANASSITAADDIRIRIPAGLDMEWDIFDGVATITGTASGKVSPAVSYEDSNKTLVLDVTSDFAVTESIAVSDLSFSSFGSATAGSLELDIDDDATADATDDKTITINNPAAVSGVLQVLSWDEVEPGNQPSPPATAITFDSVTTDVSSTDRSSASFSHTIGSGPCCGDAILVVVVGSRGDQGCSGVTYDGVPLVPSVSEQASTSTGNEWVQIFYLVNPATGTNTVEATFNILESPTMVSAMSYFGVDQSSPIGAVASDSDTAGSSTVTVDISTTVSGSIVVGGLGHHGGDTDPHDHGGDVTTEHFDVVSGGATSSDSGYAGGEIVTTSPGFYTFEWTGNVGDDWAIACVELKPTP